MVGCFYFVTVCFGLGDLNVKGTAGVTSILVTSKPGVSDIADSELMASAGLAVVIFSINRSQSIAE